jgi:RNA recognition motif-containing protein
MTKIYVGNLPFSADEAAVRQLFEQHGKVDSVSLINDRETGRPRGFGFVEMPSADAARAIQSLNGQNMGGRPLRVNEAQERERGGGGGGGRGFGGGGRSGGGGGYGGGGGGYGGGGGGRSGGGGGGYGGGGGGRSGGGGGGYGGGGGGGGRW